jgi:hypothetical protein
MAYGKFKMGKPGKPGKGNGDGDRVTIMPVKPGKPTKPGRPGIMPVKPGKPGKPGKQLPDRGFGPGRKPVPGNGGANLPIRKPRPNPGRKRMGK